MSEDMSGFIDTLKNMLHNNSSNGSNNNASDVSSSDESFSSGSNNNINISPEMISNFANMLKNSNPSNDSNSNLNSNFNNQNPESSNSNNQNAHNSDSDSFTNSIDFETIIKIKSIMEALNKKDDPRSKLLYSLKPYLRETRQKKLDQYVNLLKITQVADIFKPNKGEQK